jgi:adenylate kinase family enzyme
VQRILIAGISGAGKTTLAHAVATRLDVPQYELDALHHGPGWVKRPKFEDEVAEIAAGERWVTEDQYFSLLGDLLWRRADTVLWLDLPHATIMRQVVRRSITRVVTRRELWNGNRETVRALFDRDHPIRWAWSEHTRWRAKVEDRIATHPHLHVVHLTSRDDVRRFTGSLCSPSGS